VCVCVCEFSVGMYDGASLLSIGWVGLVVGDGGGFRVCARVVGRVACFRGADRAKVKQHLRDEVL